MKRSLIAVAAVSAVVGCLAAVLAVEVLNLGAGETRTVVEPAPLGSASDASDAGDAGLTAREIYKRAAPGVVFIRAEIVRRVQTPFGLPEEQRGEGTGSGFV